MHSVDSTELLDAVEARGAPQACLVQVNVAGEASKRASRPAELPALLDRFAAMRTSRCEGLMLIPPATATRAPTSRRCARCAIARPAAPRPNVDLRELSMGMSDDLEVAIAEGATIVRVGTAIFGRAPDRSRSGPLPA